MNAKDLILQYAKMFAGAAAVTLASFIQNETSTEKDVLLVGDYNRH